MKEKLSSGNWFEYEIAISEQITSELCLKYKFYTCEEKRYCQINARRYGDRNIDILR